MGYAEGWEQNNEQQVTSSTQKERKRMRTIIAGSRTIEDYELVAKAVSDSGFPISQVVSGCARGVDTIAINWAYKNLLPVARFPADWDKHGKAAGAIRNERMARFADALIAVWDGESKGTKNMIDTARRHGLKIHIHATNPVSNDQ